MRDSEPAGPVGARGDADRARTLVDAPAAKRGRPDAQMQQVLDMLASLGGKPVETLTPDEARAQPTAASAVRLLLREQGKSTEPEAVAEVLERTVPGPAGALPARVYRPEGADALPVLVYFHGGGWVISSPDAYDASARALANGARCVVLSVAYRRAPEHKFPAAHEDCYAAYRWARTRASEVGGDPTRVAVGGEGAGGNLAAAVSMLARDDRLPVPVHQLLVYPIADYNFDAPSYVAHANAKPLNRPMMRWFFSHYLRSPRDADTPAISPARVRDLSGLPPTTVITAEIDPLRSDGEALAERLRQCGVPVDVGGYAGVTHEFFGMGAVVDKATQAVRQAAAGLRAAFE
jgi:acetyl esterase